ncbi:TerB family tellurite resistance protein [Dinghuibacter silviterrae]|nr:TerB family tellurite resistance protein [Dinghuibacter silviterrae]
MKIILTAILIICCASQLQLASAQAAEIEQLALDIEKLAQLKGILSDMKAGYAIIHGGYSTIKGLSEGNFNLHAGYLNGLLAVNPSLQKYQRVADIIENQSLILSEYKTAFQQFKNGGRFSLSEIDYMGKVYGNLLNESLENINELATVLAAGKLRMSDDDRLMIIDHLDTDTKDKLFFLRSFNSRAAALDNQRSMDLQANQNLKILQGLP